jgi:hypothetical protein
MFRAPGLVFGVTEGVGSSLHVLRDRTNYRRYSASGPVFMFCCPELVFGGTEGVGSLFHGLRSRTHFRRYQCRWVPFSCSALPDTFSAVPSASGPFFIFCTPILVFDGTEGVGSRFLVLRARTRFRRYRGLRVLFSCFALPDSFSAVPRASGPVFIFCDPGHVFGGTECVRCVFHVLRSRTHFRRYRGRQVPFSCFTRPYSFSAVPRPPCPVFMFCAPELVFDCTEGFRSLFHVLRSRTHFRRYRGCQIPFSCFALPE